MGEMDIWDFFFFEKNVIWVASVKLEAEESFPQPYEDIEEAA